jgi:hypothetical protein
MKNFEEYTPLDSTESKKSSVFTGKQHMVNKSYCIQRGCHSHIIW